MEKYVAFPSFGIELTFNSIMFSIGPISVHWYGFIITLGIVLSVIYAMKRSKTFGIENPDTVLDMVLLAIPVAFICARLYYVVFSWEKYKNNLLDVFAIWEGGIAIYGGVIGGALGIYIFSKMKKISFLSLLDLGACSILLGQAIGRWGNFANVEAYGGETSSLFRMVIRQGTDMSVGVQPTFLYESVWNIIGFIILYLVSKNIYKFKGQMTLCYMIWYGFGRGIIEGLRTDSLYFGAFRVSQVLGFTTSAIGLIVLIFILMKRKKIGDKNDIT